MQLQEITVPKYRVRDALAIVGGIGFLLVMLQQFSFFLINMLFGIEGESKGDYGRAPIYGATPTNPTYSSSPTETPPPPTFSGSGYGSIA